MTKPLVIGVGELLWDLFPEGKKAGGAPANFVYHASHLGAEGYAVTAVGDDALGDGIIAELERNGINYIIEKTGFPTGTVEVELTRGIPQYTITENAAWDYIPLTAKALETAAAADAVCFGTLGQRSTVSRSTIRAVVENTGPDALRCFDINLRQHFYSRELVEESLDMCNVFKLNDEELAIVKNMFGLEGSDERVCRRFMDEYGLKYVILTGGADFSAVYSPAEASVIATPFVQVKDTVGAGDAFLAAFIVGILKGGTVADAHEMAVNQAALVCGRSGAWCL